MHLKSKIAREFFKDYSFKKLVDRCFEKKNEKNLIKCTVKSVFLTQYCAGGKIKKNEMGWECGVYGGGESCAQGFDGEA
jgi:hypothetical protein